MLPKHLRRFLAEILASSTSSEIGGKGRFQKFLSADGLALLFNSRRPGGEGDWDIWEAIRPAIGEPWAVKNLGPNVNSAVRETKPVLSSDGLTLVFGSDRAGGEGSFDMWMSTRDAVGTDWGPATNLGPLVNTAGSEKPSQFWEPGGLLLFKSGGNQNSPFSGLPGEGGADMFYVRVVPEPSTGAMIAFGLLFFAGFRRAAQNSHASC